MNWPGFGSLTPIQRQTYNSEAGMPLAWQQMQDFFTNNGSNLAMADFWRNQFSPQRNRYNNYALANPMDAIDFPDWIKGIAPQIAAQYANQSARNRGSMGSAFGRSGRDMW